MTVYESKIYIRKNSYALYLNRAKLNILGDEMMGDSLYYETGPYGSFRDGSWFTDFWQDLNGRNWQPIHWPEIINIRSGDAIDG